MGHGLERIGSGSTGGTTVVPIGEGGTGVALSDPGADRLLFWDDSEGEMAWLESEGTSTTFEADFNASALATPSIVVNLYDPADADGRAAFAFRSSHTGGVAGKETHTVFIETLGAGSALNTVEDSTYSLGLSNIKEDWETTTVKGQTHGLSVVTRGGYAGAFEDLSGDTTGLVVNSATASGSYCAILEGVSSYSPSDVVTKQVRCQMGVVNQGNSVYMGYYASAEEGALGSAFYAKGQSATDTWTDAFRYDADFGSGFKVYFRVNQTGHLVLNSGAATTPLKTIRVGSGGSLEFLNNAGTIAAYLADNGSLNVTGIYAVDDEQVVAGRKTGWAVATGTPTRTSFDTATVTLPQLAERVKALIDDLFNHHGLIGT